MQAEKRMIDIPREILLKFFIIDKYLATLCAVEMW
jgi:hypothetical protein